MSPVIRVDQQVFEWLSRLATPFVDTPNTVLRRVAGFDKESPMNAAAQARTGRKPSRSTLERVTGAHLNREHRLGARHALYHKDGTFFEVLRQFPGVLCDPRGYLKFDSKEQFDRDQNVSIGDKTNVHRGIASHPRYRRYDSR